MNAIVMPETAVETVSAEAVTIEAEAAAPATSLIPDTKQIPLSKRPVRFRAGSFIKKIAACKQLIN